MKRIPHSHPTLGPGEAQAAARVIRSGRVAQGLEVEGFEKEAARYIGLRHAAAVSSGTAALALALRAVGAGLDKEVIVPSYARPALIHAVRGMGAEPVLADVYWHDGNLSVAQVRRRLTHRTAAVVAVHSFGAAAEIEPLVNLGVPVVENLAQAFGAEDYNRRRLGTFGAAAVASFDAEALLTSAGEGGMVLSDDRRVADAVRDLRTDDNKLSDSPFGDVRMTDVQAAVGRVQLRRLPSFLAARRRWAMRYRDALKDLGLEVPLPLFGRAYHRFVVRSRRPVTDALLARFEEKGIGIRRPIERPLHWDVAEAGSFPVTERVWRRSLSLPIYPSLTDREFAQVVAVVREFLA
jgi:dTDP-4-amino-4,6-dideoxygalactose transaminase